MTQNQILRELRLEEKTPSLYAVLMYNDHYTTTDFVVSVLCSVFLKDPAEAQRLMLEIHQKGKASVDICSLDIARTRVACVKKMAEEAQFPLRCSVRKVE